MSNTSFAMITERRTAIFEIVSRDSFFNAVCNIGAVPEEGRTKILLDHCDRIIRFAHMLKNGESKNKGVFMKLAYKTAATCPSLVNDREAMLNAADNLLHDESIPAMGVDAATYHFNNTALSSLIEAVETEKVLITRDADRDSLDDEMMQFALMLIGFSLDVSAF